MQNQDVVVEWEKEIRTKSGLFSFQIWKYYKQQLPLAISLGLQEHLHEMCLDLSHSKNLGSKCRKGLRY